MFRRILAPVAALALLVGCTPAARQPAVAWQQVVLPAGVRPSSLAAAGDVLLVGGGTGSGVAPSTGQTADDSAPVLLLVDGTTVTGQVQPEPAEPYAAVADLISLTASGDDLYAIGRAYGGAHTNPRLTIWDGSLGAARLTSRPQEFFTFGGHDAGPLLGTLVVGGRPVIFGMRVDTTGIRAVLWTGRGTTWRERASDPVLTSGADRELGFAAVTAQQGRLVVAGDEVTLAGTPQQRPLVAAGTITGPWSRALLPVPDSLPVQAGQLSRATGVACAAQDGRCWVTGWVRGHPLAWPVTIATDGRWTWAPPPP